MLPNKQNPIKHGFFGTVSITIFFVRHAVVHTVPVHTQLRSLNKHFFFRGSRGLTQEEAN